MRVVEIYTKGGFQKLVLDSKKEFAKTYGLQADYWRHFAVEESPEVLSYLKSNLKDLANHYHAQYQRAELAEEKPANYREALQWYREFLASFPKDAESPPINLPAGRLAAGRQELRRSGERVRAHGLRLSAARKGVSGRLRRDLCASRESESRRRGTAADHQARRDRELTQVCRRLPAA